MKRCWLFFFLALVGLRVHAAELALAAVFGEHMVLQRDQPLELWGRGRPGVEVGVALAGLRGQARVGADGRWRARLPGTLPAGGPHELRVDSGGASVALRDVWLGDVWLLGGQSNMAWPLDQSMGGPEEAARAELPWLRHLRVPNRASLQPQDEIVPAPWVAAKPGASGEFSAVGWFFARRLHEAPGMAGVPIGLLNVAWSGSHLETWVRRDAALADPALAAVARAQATDDAAWAARKRESLTATVRRFQPALPWPASGGFEAPDLDDTAWPTLQAPGLWEGQGLPDVDGIVWHRKAFTLTAAQAAGPALLHLAKIDDCDDTYVNGQRVGGICHYDTPRRYELPAGVLKEGRNVIAVRVNDTGGGGGFHGDAALMRLDTAAGSVSLAGTWRVRVTEPLMPAHPSANDGISLAHNGLVHPLQGLRVRGMLWYQGESNTGRAVAYAGQFQRLITDWRAQFGDPKLPFLFVQLSAFHPLAHNSWEKSGWAELRDAQRQALVLPQTAMAVTIDVGDPVDIHPRDKRTVGERLARQALHLLDARQPAAHGPVFRSARRAGLAMELTFETSGLSARPAGAVLEGFAIAGADRRFRPAQARIEGGRVIVWHPEVPEPAAVRYAWLDNPSPSNLVDGEGLPASPFRTDEWPLSTAGARYEP